MTQPIRPDELKQEIPEQVFAAVNKLLKNKYRNDSNSITLKQDDIIDAILAELQLRPHSITNNDHARNQIFNNGWLNIEPYYREAGWSVEYDKPGYCESYAATFKFSFRKSKGTI